MSLYCCLLYKVKCTLCERLSHHMPLMSNTAHQVFPSPHSSSVLLPQLVPFRSSSRLDDIPMTRDDPIPLRAIHSQQLLLHQPITISSSFLPPLLLSSLFSPSFLCFLLLSSFAAHLGLEKLTICLSPCYSARHHERVHRDLRNSLLQTT